MEPRPYTSRPVLPGQVQLLQLRLGRVRARPPARLTSTGSARRSQRRAPMQPRLGAELPGRSRHRLLRRWNPQSARRPPTSIASSQACASSPSTSGRRDHRRVRARPARAATLEALQRSGVNRLSFGVQSFVDRESSAVGRLHTAASAALSSTASAPPASQPLARPDRRPATPDRDTGGTRSSRPSRRRRPPQRLHARGGRRLAPGPRGAPGAPATAPLPYHPTTTRRASMRACDDSDAAGIAQYEISNFARARLPLRHNRSTGSARPTSASVWTPTPCCAHDRGEVASRTPTIWTSTWDDGQGIERADAPRQREAPGSGPHQCECKPSKRTVSRAAHERRGLISTGFSRASARRRSGRSSAPWPSLKQTVSCIDAQHAPHTARSRLSNGRSAASYRTNVLSRNFSRRTALVRPSCLKTQEPSRCPSICAATPSPGPPQPCGRPWPRPRSATTSTAKTPPSTGWSARRGDLRPGGRHLCSHRHHGQPDRHPAAHAARAGGPLRGPRARPRLGDGDGRRLLRLPAPHRRRRPRHPDLAASPRRRSRPRSTTARRPA